MKRVHDERNLIFSRVKLKEGTKHYQAYYDNYPERKAEDDALRGGDFRDALKIDGTTRERLFPLFRENARILRSLYRALDETTLGERQAIPKDYQTNLKAIAKHYGALDVGIVKLKEEHFYSHRGGLSTAIGLNDYGEEVIPHYTHAIVYLVSMDKDYINRAPYIETLLETENAYLKMAFTGMRLALYLKQLGYKSIFQSEAYYLTPLVPLAYDAGLGEIGIGNHLVHPTYGNAIRLGAVLTTCALPADAPIDFGLQAFCKRCALCLMNCPSRSITPHEQWVNGRRHYRFNDVSCFKLWKTTGTDCALCIQSCPFTQGIDEATRIKLKENPEAIDDYLKEMIDKRGRRPQNKTPHPIVIGGKNDETND